MPRPRSSRPPPGPPRPPGRLSASLDTKALDRALREIVPDARERSFVLRCILEEGPRHHRVASWALLRLLAALLEELGGADPDVRAQPSEPLEMRVPPDVKSASEDAHYPIGIPTRLLEEVLAEEQAVELAVECLSDGPPHHALANAMTVWLIEAIAERVRAEGARRTRREPEAR